MTKPSVWTDKYIIGVDEAGRGPLAGPVTVGVSCVPYSTSKKLFSFLKKEGMNDSKQVKEKDRERIFKIFTQFKKEGKLDFVVISTSAEIISEKGIVFAINSAISKGIKKLKISPEHSILQMDGALKVPSGDWKKSGVYTKGDSLYPSIMLASIVAKVTRDTYMKKIAQKYPEYQLDVHKGYGTKKHRELIKKYGLSKEHRVGWFKGIESLR